MNYEAYRLIKNPVSDINIIKITKNESKEHFLKKAKLCYDLFNSGKSFVNQVSFWGGGSGFTRPDIFVLDDKQIIQIIDGNFDKKHLMKMRLYFHGMDVRFKVIEI